MRSSSEDPSALLAGSVEDLYRAFAGYRLGPHVEGCPHCVSEQDHARIYARPLRSLTADDLNRYAFKALTTWGDENDFRHFLPRILELTVRGHPDWYVDTEIVLGKLRDANWQAWPGEERDGVRSFLRLRWSVGLTQDAAASQELDAPGFDADAWLCGIARAGDDSTAYVDAWRRQGATSTIGHVAAFLEKNPDLLIQGKLGGGFWELDNSQTAACANAMRTWLAACMEDPGFQMQLAALYQS